MSNPNNQNNPFLPYLTEENNNNDNNRNDNENQNEKNNDISKILEEGTATAIPPPAYNEIVRPQPTQAGFDYPSYPPPPFPTSETPVENNYSTNVYRNSNERKGSRAACCVGNSRRKTCSCGWMIFLIILVILGVLSIVNNSACNNLSLGANPENFFFDTSTNPVFLVNADNARIKHGEIRIFPKNINEDSQTVRIEVYSGTTGITPRFETLSRGGVFELKISQPGFSIFNIPSRCMKSQINVYLPQQLGGFLIPYPNTIQVKHQDITMMGNDTPYRQNITLVTADGDINLNGVRAQNLNIRTDDGDISGSITSISNELYIITDDGDLNLTLGNAQTPFTPRFTVITDDGDVELKFDGNSFSGNYNVQSNDGSIQIDNNKFGNKAVGTINNNVGGDLKISTDNGDVDIKFQAV